MVRPTVAEHPAEKLKHWLLHEWGGRLRPFEVRSVQAEDADGRDAWFFLLILPEPEEETWDADDLAELRRGVRDKALEVGLTYPWYLVPRTEHDEPVEDESDLPSPNG